MISKKTKVYWLNTLCGWAEDRLSPPQFDECCAVLREYASIATDRKWCRSCGEFVEPEGTLDADGIYDTCPYCGKDIENE